MAQVVKIEEWFNVSASSLTSSEHLLALQVVVGTHRELIVTITL